MLDTHKAYTSPFLRAHSGLTRAIGAWDVFIFNLGLISVGIGLVYTQRFATAYYPGGNIPLATAFATLLMVPIVFAMWAWTTAIPRSGGIYVFLTRSFHPALGFALSFVECISWLFYVAIAAKLIVTAGIVPLVGLLLGFDSTLVQTLQEPTSLLIIGLCVLWTSITLLVLGTRRYLITQRIVFFIALAGTIALVYVLLTSTFNSHSLTTLIHGLNADPALEIKQRATSLGWNSTSTSINQSLRLLVWPFLPLIGSVFSISLGGEVMNNSRNQIVGMLGSLLVSAIAFATISVLAAHAIGADLQGTVGYAWDASQTSPGSLGGLHILAEPWFPILAGLDTSNTLLRILICLGFIAWIYFWIPGVLAYCGRAMLAWALDRVAPAWLGRLNQRHNTPWLTYVAGGIIASLFLVLILLTNFFATLTFILAAAIAWCVAMAAGIALPWRPIYRHTNISNWRFGPIPLISLFCTIGCLSLLTAIYFLWNDDLAAGHSIASLCTIGITFLLGVVLYFTSSYIRATHGVPISRGFREIPVE